MSVKWTKEQLQVINARNKSLLVSAAAGSGKTAVLVERILSLITDADKPVDIDCLLVVTFTNAAAAQMREKITKAIDAALQADPDNHHLIRQSSLIHNAQITTIDSFCTHLIRSHFHRIGLDPDFRVADEGELRLIREDIIKRVLDELYARKDPDFLLFAESYSNGKNEDAIRDMVFSLYNQARSNPWPSEWLEKGKESFAVSDADGLEGFSWYQMLQKDLNVQISEYLQETKDLLAAALEPDGPDFCADLLQDDISFYSGLLKTEAYENRLEILTGYDWKRFPTKKNFQGNTELKDYIKGRRNHMKEGCKKLVKDLFSSSEKEQLEMIRYTGRMYDVLCRIVDSFHSQFQAQKKKLRIVDFSDIEHFALQILIDPETKMPTEVAAEYRARFREVMIDEYQDSNYVQETLLSAVSGDPEGIENRFMVGDIKQSIYRFRLARPELFLEKYQTFTSKESSRQRIDLHQNFRSREEVLSFSNMVFEKLMQPDIGRVAYDDAARLYHGRSDDADPAGDYTPEILLLQDTESAAEQIRLEARMIAARIRRMVEEQEIKGLTYGDIVILMRAPNPAAETFQEVFHEEGIPLILEAKTGYFAAREVKQVLSLLQVIDNPMQDIPLAASMRSPFGNFTSDELAKISAAFAKMPFHRAVMLYARSDTDDSILSACDISLKKKILAFLSFLQEYRDKMRDMPIYRLLDEIYSSTGFPDYVRALPAGKQRRANLDMLMGKAIAYSETSYQGLSQFNRYIERLRKYEIDFGEAEIAEERVHAVRLMSIHQSKGLEFPVVFVAGCGKQFNTKDLNQSMVIHPDLGCGLRMINRSEHRRQDTILRQALSQDLKKENFGEEMRILYVAMTRAEKKLILTGSCKEEIISRFFNQPVQSNNRLHYMDKLSAGNYFDWILPTVSADLPVRIRVISQEELAADRTILKEHIKKDRDTLLRQAYATGDAEYEALKRSFAWKYPYPDLKGIRQKISVSELKHRSIEQMQQIEEAEPESNLIPPKVEHPYYPEFMKQEDTESGAGYGTLMHRFLQMLDYAALPEDAARRVDAALCRLHEMQGTDSELKMLSERQLTGFLTSDLVVRMIRAAQNQTLYLEQPFVMSIQASRVWPDAPADEDVLTQGIIDVYWEEADGIVLMDYKTDRVDSAAELIKRYETQLRLYEEALNRRFPEKQVKEIVIYSFRLAEAVRITPCKEC